MHYELSYINWAGAIMLLVTLLCAVITFFDEMVGTAILEICLVVVFPPILLYTANQYAKDVKAYTEINPNEVYVVIQKKETANTGCSFVLEDKSGRVHLVEDVEKQVYDQYEVGSTLNGSSIEEDDSNCNGD